MPDAGLLLGEEAKLDDAYLTTVDPGFPEAASRNWRTAALEWAARASRFLAEYGSQQSDPRISALSARYNVVVKHLNSIGEHYPDINVDKGFTRHFVDEVEKRIPDSADVKVVVGGAVVLLVLIVAAVVVSR